MNEVNRTCEKPAVSVLIPAYNAAPYIAETLDSVFAQTFAGYEVIVVNDGSPDTDELERVLTPFLDRIVYLKQDNRGPSAARNEAIRQARGAYVATLDSDDTWLPEYLATQMGFLAANAEFDLVYTDAWLFGDTELAGRTFMQGSPSNGPVTFESLLRYETSIITSCVVMRRQAAIDAGLFDENFIRCEDFDLWLRMAHHGCRMTYQRQVLAKHRVHRASLAFAQIKMVEAQIEVLEKAQRTLSLTQAQQELIEAQLENCSAQISLEEGKKFLAAHDYVRAAKALTQANSFYKSRKLQLVLLGLRSAPRVLHSLYVLRQSLGRSVPTRRVSQK
jgi:glycosyltransferase involved in cell wall biosynthesis